MNHARSFGARRGRSPVALTVVLGAILVGCAAPPTASLSPDQTAEVVSVASESPSPRATQAPLPEGLYPHDAVDLEALLPETVAGRTLTRWSVSGVNYFSIGATLTDEELASITAELATAGLTIDDFSMALAGRSDLGDPPYLIELIRVRGVAARDLPLDMSLDHPDAGDLVQVSLGGKDVWRGVPAMVSQTAHQRGTPFVYLSGEHHFTVLTEQEDWAADAISQLP